MNRFIAETKHHQVILSEDQTYFGRCVVVLSRPCETLAHITHEELDDFLKLVQTFEHIFKEEYGATMFNYCCLMNNAYQKTSPDPQVHWHFRPRYNKSIFFDGVEFSDPNFGHHYIREPQRILPVELQEKIIEDLRSKFARDAK